MKDTKQQFEHVIAVCRDLFSKKLHDYGPAWRILRPSSVTDQIFIKANRIRSIETKGVTLVDEGIRSEFIAIVNYGIVGLIQLELGYAEAADMTNEERIVLIREFIMEDNRDHARFAVGKRDAAGCPALLKHFDLRFDLCAVRGVHRKAGTAGRVCLHHGAGAV